MHEANHHRRVSDLFIAARELNPEARNALLDRECGDDLTLRRDVEALLRQDDQPSKFLDRPALGDGFRVQGAESLAAETPSIEQIGAHRVRRLLGQGAMGRVYLVEQTTTGGLVALKVLHPTLIDPQIAARFEQEVRILGRLRHPSIAQIYDAGSIDLGAGAQPYFTMEYVDGESLLDHANRANLTTNARLELIARIADAVHHAHEQGVIHRDLKPDNILVTADGTPKILDFGVARTTGQDLRATMQTATGQILGTVRYMSPEQAGGQTADIDARSDIYALGVLAHELLAGRLPYALDGKSVAHALRVILDEEPTRLGSIESTWRGDVETVIGRALEKEPARRYDTAASFADDLRRYLRHEPIIARPASTIYRVRKFAQRNRLLVGGLAAIFVILIAATTLSMRFGINASRAHREVERQSYRSCLVAASLFLQNDDIAALAAQLELAPEHLRGWEWAYLSGQTDEALGVLAGHTSSVYGVNWSPDGQQIATSSWDQTVKLWNAETMECTATLTGHTGRVYDVVYSPDGSQLASASWDQTVRLWDVKTGTLLRTMDEHDGRVYAVAFSPDGRRLVSASGDHTVRIWDVATGTPVRTIAAHAEEVFDARYSPDGRTIVSCSGDSTIFTWDAETGVRRNAFVGHGPEGVISVKWMPDGLRFVSSSRDKTARIWDAATGDLLLTLTATEHLMGLAVTPDGNRILAANGGGDIQIWDATTGLSQQKLRGHGKAAMSLAVSPDGRWLASASVDQQCRVWLLSNDDSRTLRGHTTSVSSLAFSADGTRLVSTSTNGVVCIWDPVRGEQLALLGDHQGTLYDCAFSPDGRLLATCGRDNQTRVYNARTGQAISTISDCNESVTSLLFSDDGQSLLTCCQDLGITRHHALTGQFIETLAELGVAAGRIRYSLDRTHVLAAVGAHSIQSIDLATGQCEEVAAGWDEPIIELKLSPDGQYLAACTQSSTARVWTRRLNGTFEVLCDLPLAGRAVAFDLDSTRLFYGDGPVIRILDLPTGEELLTLSAAGGEIIDLTMSPDGRTLASAHGDGTVHLWDAVPRNELLRQQDDLRQAALGAAQRLEELQRKFPNAETIAEHLLNDITLTDEERRTTLNALLHAPSSR